MTQGGASGRGGDGIIRISMCVLIIVLSLISCSVFRVTSFPGKTSNESENRSGLSSQWENFDCIK